MTTYTYTNSLLNLFQEYSDMPKIVKFEIQAKYQIELDDQAHD